MPRDHPTVAGDNLGPVTASRTHGNEVDHGDVLAMLGQDPNDSTSLAPQGDTNYVAGLKEQKGPWKLGVPQEFFGEGIDPEVMDRADETWSLSKMTFTHHNFRQ